MQVTETSSEGLKRTLKVVVGVDELGERFSSRLESIKGQVQLKGFRKGKVPVAHIKKVYGRSVMSEVLEDTIRETSTKAVQDRNERPALMPEIKLADSTDIEPIIDGKKELAYEMSFEVLPNVTLADLSALKLEKLVAEVDEDSIQQTINELAERSNSFAEEAGRRAEMGDRVTIDFVGRIDGTEFERGSGENLQLVLGNANFIPGFEEGIVGAGAGDKRDVKATFPADYPVAELAGKEAVFETR